MTTRTPVETRTPRMEPLARLPVFFALAGKRAVIAGGNAAAAWKAELLAAAGASVDVYAANPAEEMLDIAAQASITIHRRNIVATDFANAALAVGAFEDDGRSRRICRTCARRRRAGQCHRQACVLRFLLRRHRQPFAARHRHLDRRRCAGVRAGDPRQARSADPARLCALGGGGARMASTRAGARALVPRAAPFLGALHRACGGRTRAHAVIERHRCTDGRRARRRANSRLRHSGRRRPRRPRTAHAARGARAAIRRCDPDRRSRLTAGARLRAARGEEDDGRQDGPWARVQAVRDQRPDDQARQSRQARGAAEGRRSHDLRPRRRRDRGLPRREHSGRGGARHFGRAGRSLAPARLAHASRAGAPPAIRHWSRPRRQPARRYRLACARGSCGDHHRLHAEEDAARAFRARDGARPRSRNARGCGRERHAAG